MYYYKTCQDSHLKISYESCPTLIFLYYIYIYMNVMYPVLLADVEMRLGQVVCVAPGKSVSASPSRQAAVVPDDHLSARRCRSLGDASEAVPHVKAYVAP